MSNKRPSGSPKETKKEYCPCIASGQTCIQDTSPAAIPADTNDNQMSTCIYRRTLDSPLQHHPEPFSFPQDRQQTNRLSDKGEPVVEGGPNDELVELEFLRLSSTTPSDIGSSLLESSTGSSLLSASHFRGCPICSLLMEKFRCEHSKQFWREIDNEGPDINQSCHNKFFVKFLERLKDKFQDEPGLKSSTTINLLKYLLQVNLTDGTAGVKLVNLRRAVKLFGPIRLQEGTCVFIHQLYQLIKKSLKARDRESKLKTSWFVGEMMREKAEEGLLDKDCKDKTFLVRISATDGDDGDFVLSVRHEDHCHHLKIQGDPKLALEESPYHAHLKFAGQEFASLPDVIDYITRHNDIKIEEDDADEGQTCTSVTCLRVFSKSPLNGPMSGYEKARR